MVQQWLNNRTVYLDLLYSLHSSNQPANCNIYTQALEGGGGVSGSAPGTHSPLMSHTHLDSLAYLSHVILRQIQELLHQVTVYKTLSDLSGVLVEKRTIATDLGQGNETHLRGVAMQYSRPSIIRTLNYPTTKLWCASSSPPTISLI